MKKIRLLLAAFAAMVGLGASAQGWTAQAPADGDFYLYNVGSGKFLSCGSEYWGTKACIDNGALKFTLADQGSGAYKLFTTSTFSYGNPNAAQLQSSGYVDQSVTATTWTFGEVDGLENTYTLLNAAGTYLVAPSDGTKSILLNSDAPANAYGYWKLINKDNLFLNASEDNPADITCLIGDANFESNNGTMKGFWTMDASNQNLCGGAIPNNNAESYCSSFTLSQELSVPNGKYQLTAQAAVTEYSVTGADMPYVYANDATATFSTMTHGENSMTLVGNQFTAGEYVVGPIDVTVTNGTLTIGAKGTRTNTWCVFDNFQLTYLGLDLSDLKNALILT